MTKLAVLDKAGKKVSDTHLNGTMFAIDTYHHASYMHVSTYIHHQPWARSSTPTPSDVPRVHSISVTQ